MLGKNLRLFYFQLHCLCCVVDNVLIQLLTVVIFYLHFHASAAHPVGRLQQYVFGQSVRLCVRKCVRACVCGCPDGGIADRLATDF